MADTVTHRNPDQGWRRGVPQERLCRRARRAADRREIDLATFDITDPEFWRQEAYWDYFARMRKEDPVNYCPDSPFGPYWS